MAYFIHGTDGTGAVITSGMPQACRYARDRSAEAPDVTFTVTADGPRTEGYFESYRGTYVPGPHRPSRPVADYLNGEQVRSY